MTRRWQAWTFLLLLPAFFWWPTRSHAQPPQGDAVSGPAPTAPAAKACSPEPGPDEGCRGEESQHSYRFALLKHWFPDVPGTIPMYAVDRHPDVPSHHKLLRYCAPAVEPQYLYATPRDRW